MCKNKTIFLKGGAFTTFSEVTKAVEKLNSLDRIQQPSSRSEHILLRLEGKGLLSAFQAGYKELDLFKKMDFEGMAPHDSEQIEMISDYLNGMEELNPLHWSGLSVEQRVDILNSIDEKIAGITKRTPCRIEPADLEENCYGKAFPDGRIHINQRLINDGSGTGLSKCIETLLHEGRHAYQDYNMDVRIVEQNSERVESWKLNREIGYENGKSGFFDYRNMRFKRYLAQPVEVDARVFAESVLDKMNL